MQQPLAVMASIGLAYLEKMQGLICEKRHGRAEII